MMTFILLISLSVVSTVITFFLKRFEITQMIVAGVCTCAWIGLIAVTCTLFNREHRFANTIEQYENIKCMADDYNSLPDSCKFSQTFEYDIRKECLEINNIISAHKVMCKSIWVAPWYSKEIGSLKKLRVYGSEKTQQLHDIK